MNKFYNDIINELEASICELRTEVTYPLGNVELIIHLIENCLSRVKKYVLTNGFRSIEAEIHFFKHQKPAIVAQLIYYNAIYKIEMREPYGKKSIRKYLKNELNKLKQFFEKNDEFYKYYRNNNTFLDEKCFVREKHDIRLCLDTFYFEADHRFSTSHDYKVAKIIANDLIRVYLKERLNITNNKKSSDTSLNWTGSKTALTELIYALFAQGVFNNGNADIKAIAKVFKQMFNIDLGDFYHTFMELKARKINRTKFIDSLRNALVKKMDEQEDEF